MKKVSKPILILEPLPCSDHGGQPLATFAIAKGLAQQGYMVSLVAFQDGDLIHHYQDFCKQTILIEDYRIGKENAWQSFMQLTQGLFKIWQNYRIYPSGVIYFSNHRCGLFAVLLGWLLRWKTVLHICTAMDPALFHQQDRWAVQNTDRYITVSENVKIAWLQALNLKPKRIINVYNGIDTHRFIPASNPLEIRRSLNLPQDYKIISYIGRLSPTKGLEVLLYSFARLVQTTSESVFLAIAGSPSGFAKDKDGQKYFEQIQDLQKQLDLTGNSKFLGHLADPLCLYQASDLTVLASTYAEPFGLVIIESMACGVPVIASEVGGIPEILNPNFSQLLVKPNDVDSLYNALQHQIQWRSTNPQLGMQCRNHVLNYFSLEKHLINIENVLVRV